TRRCHWPPSSCAKVTSYAGPPKATTDAIVRYGASAGGGVAVTPARPKISAVGGPGSHGPLKDTRVKCRSPGFPRKIRRSSAEASDARYHTRHVYDHSRSVSPSGVNCSRRIV